MTGELIVSRETNGLLSAFVEDVKKWSPKVNLVSSASVPDMDRRHVQDSAQLFQHLSENDRHWVDLGSGGGFPGIVIAILAKEQRPDLRVSLVESDHRKATFLRLISARLELNVAVFSQRIEELAPLTGDVVSARALAPLTKLLGYVQRHISPNGTALLLKGRDTAEEIATARKTWQFRMEEIDSVTSDGASLLKIKDIRNA